MYTAQVSEVERCIQVKLLQKAVYGPPRVPEMMHVQKSYSPSFRSKNLYRAQISEGESLRSLSLRVKIYGSNLPKRQNGAYSSKFSRNKSYSSCFKYKKVAYSPSFFRRNMV